MKSAHEGIRDGAEVRLTQKIGPFTSEWLVRHEGYEAGRSFADRQVTGPFRQWRHEHRFEAINEEACELSDEVFYELPMDRIAAKAAGPLVRRELARLFRYRHEVTRMDLETHRLPSAPRPLVVAVTGATGLIGSSLTALLRTAGHEVRAISRGRAADIQWDPAAGRIDPKGLEGGDAIIHLAGEPIAQRWTKEARRRILESRRDGTRLLAETVANLKRPPQVFVSISGVNAYGAIQPEPVTEESPFGEGFLANVCREWEGASRAVEDAGIRRVIVRSGMVLSPAGGALAKLLPPFRAGLGGPIGRGERWMSWIAIDDLAAVLAHAVLDERYRGVVNAVAPNPVRNREFSATLAAALHRPAFFAVPPAALRAMFGEMADETILGSVRVVPERLRESGYRFRYPLIEQAWSHLLGTNEESLETSDG